MALLMQQSCGNRFPTETPSEFCRKNRGQPKAAEWRGIFNNGSFVYVR
jgi:hypothetical protein